MVDDNIRIRYENGRKIVEITARGGDLDTVTMKAMETAARVGGTYRSSPVAERWLGDVMVGQNAGKVDVHNRNIAYWKDILRQDPNDSQARSEIQKSQDSREFYSDQQRRHQRMANGGSYLKDDEK